MSRGGYQCTSCGASHVYSTYLLTRIGRETLIHGCQCGAKHRLTIQGAIQLEQGNTNPSLPRLPSLPVVPNERTFNAALIPPVDEPPVELPVTEWITEGHPVHVGWYELRFASSGEQIARWWWDGLRYRMSKESSIHIEADAPSMWRGLQTPILGRVYWVDWPNIDGSKCKATAAQFVSDDGMTTVGVSMIFHSDGVRRTVSAEWFYHYCTPVL